MREDLRASAAHRDDRSTFTARLPDAATGNRFVGRRSGGERSQTPGHRYGAVRGVLVDSTDLDEVGLQLCRQSELRVVPVVDTEPLSHEPGLGDPQLIGVRVEGSDDPNFSGIDVRAGFGRVARPVPASPQMSIRRPSDAVGVSGRLT